MLLKSSLFLILLANIFISDIRILAFITCILIIFNVQCKISVIQNVKKIRFLFFLYFITCILQIFYTQEGRVLLKVHNYYVTYEGIMNFSLNFLRIVNLLLLSWIVVAKKLLTSKMSRYQFVIEKVIELVPDALVMIRKKMKIKWFFRYILNQIKVKK